MLFLLFQLGTERYALDAGQVVAVLPRLGVKEIPHAPPAVAGLCHYRGSPAPVIDLGQLALGRPCALNGSKRTSHVRKRGVGLADVERTTGIPHRVVGLEE